MIKEREKGERFFRFQFMEGGKRISWTFNGKKGLPVARSKQEARDHESELRIRVRTQLRDGTYGKEVGLEAFGTFFDRVFLPYAKEHKVVASVRHSRRFLSRQIESPRVDVRSLYSLLEDSSRACHNSP